MCFNLDSHSSPRVSTQSSTTTSFAESTNSSKPSRRNIKGNILVRGKEQNKEKEIFTFVAVAVASAAIMSLLVLFLVLRYRKKTPRARPGMLYTRTKYIYTESCIALYFIKSEMIEHKGYVPSPCRIYIHLVGLVIFCVLSFIYFKVLII